MRLLRNSFFILCVVTFFTTHLNGQYVWVRKLSGAAFSVSYNPRNHNTIYRGGSNNVSVSYDAGQSG